MPETNAAAARSGIEKSRVREKGEEGRGRSGSLAGVEEHQRPGDSEHRSRQGHHLRRAPEPSDEERAGHIAERHRKAVAGDPETAPCGRGLGDDPRLRKKPLRCRPEPIKKRSAIHKPGEKCSEEAKAAKPESIIPSQTSRASRGEARALGARKIPVSTPTRLIPLQTPLRSALIPLRSKTSEESRTAYEMTTPIGTARAIEIHTAGGAEIRSLSGGGGGASSGSGGRMGGTARGSRRVVSGRRADLHDFAPLV